MHPTHTALVPLSIDVQDAIESIMLLKAGHTATVFYWDDIPVEHWPLLATTLNDFYDVAIGPLDLRGLTVIEICGLVQKQMMRRLDSSPRPDDVYAAICEAFDETLDIQADALRFEQLFVDDLAVDSLSKIQIVADLEDRYGVRVTDKELDQLRTIGDIVAYIVVRTPSPLAV